MSLRKYTETPHGICILNTEGWQSCFLESWRTAHIQLYHIIPREALRVNALLARAWPNKNHIEYNYCMIVKLTRRNYRQTIREALAVLTKEGVIAYPSETFYGLGARYDSPQALRKLYLLKKRPAEKPMPVIIGRIDQLRLVTDSLSDLALTLISEFWPGPLTLLLKARKGLSPYISFHDKVAVRMPGESFALDLAAASEFPISATSANVSTMPPASCATAVVEYFNDALDMIVDGGTTRHTRPSTIVDVTGKSMRVIREGALAIHLLRDSLRS